MGFRIEGLFNSSTCHLVADLCQVCTREINLVDNGNDGQVCFCCEQVVGHGLGLDPLGCIHEKQHALAGCKAPRDLSRRDSRWNKIGDRAVSD